MTLTKNQLDMLYRVALAELYTSPTEPATYDRGKVLARLHALGLVSWFRAPGDARPTGRSVLTDDGRETLDRELDRERAGDLRRCRERQAARLARTGGR